MTVTIVPTLSTNIRNINSYAIVKELNIASSINILAKKAQAPFCSATPGGIWFPTVEGVTSLPPAPSRVTNPAPRPVNAATVPADFDETDLCRLFQDILPVSSPPVYEEELTVEYVYKPYNERIPVYGIIKPSISVESFPYKINLGSNEIFFSIKIVNNFSRFPAIVFLRVSNNLFIEKLSDSTRKATCVVNTKFTVSQSISIPLRPCEGGR